MSFKKVPLLFLNSHEEKMKLFSYLDQLERQSSIKIVILHGSNDSPDRNDYLQELESWKNFRIDSYTILRAHNALNQAIFNIIESSKFYIWVQSGKVLLPFLGLGLSCDYRIVADNLIVQNPAPMAGLIPEGAVAFFFSQILGHSRGLNILLSDKDIGAYELFRLGLVDKVQPYNKLKYIAMEIARDFACKPTTALCGTKKLINHSLRDISKYLDYESEQLIHTLKMIKQESSSAIQ